MKNEVEARAFGDLLFERRVLQGALEVAIQAMEEPDGRKKEALGWFARRVLEISRDADGIPIQQR